MQQINAPILPASQADPKEPSRMRLFFALPLTPLQSSIANLQQRIITQARPVTPSNLHLTLLFLGMHPYDALPRLSDMARSIQLPSFDLSLDQFGVFPRAAVLWLGPQTIPTPLLDLAKALQRGGIQLALDFDTQTPFTPHVTLFRKWRHEPPDRSSPLHLSVQHFSLYQSVSTPEGVRYLELERFSLMESHHAL